jgi:predicted nucleic acid-binding protein
MRLIVDTNVLLRLATEDSPAHTERLLAYLERVDALGHDPIVCPLL